MKRDITTEKILKAAEELFAEKGFDRTSTAAIAKRAGVNSALIFYYFGNKENLLKTLVSEKALSFRHERYDAEPQASENFINKIIPETMLSSMFEKTLEFMCNSEDMFRILAVEALKKDKSGIEVFQINEAVLNDMLKDLNIHEDKVGDRLMLEIKELFFILIPVVMFTLMKKKMVNYYKVPEKTLKIKLTEALRDIYINSYSKELGIEVV